MKIDNSNKSLAPTTVSDTSSRTNSAKVTGQMDSQGAPSGVSVTLGSTSSQLRNIQSNFADTPMVDSKKIAEIKQAISEGRFQINSSAIADSLINNVEDLLNADGRD